MIEDEPKYLHIDDVMRLIEATEENSIEEVKEAAQTRKRSVSGIIKNVMSHFRSMKRELEGSD